MWKDKNGCISESCVSPTSIIIAEVPLNKDPHCEPAEKKGSTILEHFPLPLGGATLPLMPPSSPQQHSHPLSLHPLRGKITITKEHSEDYQINIGHGLFVPASSTWSIPPFPHFSLNLSLTRSLWLIRVFTLCPSSSLTASGYRIVEGESLDEQKDMKRKCRGGGCNERFSSLSLRFSWFTVARKHTHGIYPTNHTVPAELWLQEKRPNLF